MLPWLPLPTPRADGASSKITLCAIPESLVHVTAVLAETVSETGCTVELAVRNVAEPMQNVALGHVGGGGGGGGGGGETELPPPPHDIRPIDKIATPNRPEIFRIIPPNWAR
jgi:hypothetical protein